MERWARVGALVAGAILTWQGIASAQAIAGVVKDATGGVMPGVTVEAASPALIEKIRTVVTDSDGQYKIINLRPGTYTVTFTLAGFNSRQARRRRDHQRLHRAGQRRNEGRRHRRNDHRLGPEPAHRHPERHPEEVAHAAT